MRKQYPNNRYLKCYSLLSLEKRGCVCYSFFCLLSFTVSHRVWCFYFVLLLLTSSSSRCNLIPRSSDRLLYNSGLTVLLRSGHSYLPFSSFVSLMYQFPCLSSGWVVLAPSSTRVSPFPLSIPGEPVPSYNPKIRSTPHFGSLLLVQEYTPKYF